MNCHVPVLTLNTPSFLSTWQARKRGKQLCDRIQITHEELLLFFDEWKRGQ